MNQKGMTLIELAVTGVIAIIISVAVGFTFKTMMSNRQRGMDRAKFESDVLALADLILQVGRIAKPPVAAGAVPGCHKIDLTRPACTTNVQVTGPFACLPPPCGNPTCTLGACTCPGTPPAFSGDGLRCFVDFEVPPTGNTTEVRLMLVPGPVTGTQQVAYQRIDSGAINLIRNFREITEFTVCDDLDMQGGTCAIGPAKISTQHGNNIRLFATAAGDPWTDPLILGGSANDPAAATSRPIPSNETRTLPNRFFRFRIRAVASENDITITDPRYNDDSAKVARGLNVFFQSAFHVRNPVAFTTGNYQWGSLE